MNKQRTKVINAFKRDLNSMSKNQKHILKTYFRVTNINDLADKIVSKYVFGKKARMDGLPPEIWKQIAKKMTPRDISALSQTSKSMYKITNPILANYKSYYEQNSNELMNRARNIINSINEFGIPMGIIKTDIFKGIYKKKNITLDDMKHILPLFVVVFGKPGVDTMLYNPENVKNLKNSNGELYISNMLNEFRRKALKYKNYEFADILKEMGARDVEYTEGDKKEYDVLNDAQLLRLEELAMDDEEDDEEWDDEEWDDEEWDEEDDGEWDEEGDEEWDEEDDEEWDEEDDAPVWMNENWRTNSNILRNPDLKWLVTKQL